MIDLKSKVPNFTWNLYMIALSAKRVDLIHQDFDNIIAFWLPVQLATNFHIRLTREIAEKLVSEGSEKVMCKEYGEDEDWCSVDSDYFEDNADKLTLEYFGDTEQECQKILEYMWGEFNGNIIEYYDSLKD